MAEHRTVDSVRRRVRESLERTGLAPGGALVAAVSGGPDSLAMLNALAHLRGVLGLRLHCAHLDHALRGEDSRQDAAFVAEVSQRLGVPHTVERADVAAYRSRRRVSMEEAARNARYAFLARVALDRGARAVAVGHTSDDQAETVLMHVIRGSGLTGLRGMAERARVTFEENEVVLIRPMLALSRRETEGYCRALGLEPRLDETNLSLEPTRNRIRSELFPMLERYNPAVRESLVRLSRLASRDAAYIEAGVDEAWDGAARREGEAVLLDLSAFRRLAPALQGHLLRRAIRTVKGDLEDVEQNHVDGMIRLTAGPAGRSLDLPGGIRFSTGYGEARIGPAGGEDQALPPLEGEHPLLIPGETMLPGWRVAARVRERAAAWPHEPASLGAAFDYAGMGGGLRVRTRLRGDRFQPLGMSGSKKLQDFMVDAKIPRSLRDGVPLVVSERGIAWVVGWRVAEWASPKDDGGAVLELRFLRREDQG